MGRPFYMESMMRRLLLPLLIFPALSFAAEWQQSPFGERGVYQLESQFSYISAWGVTALHDRVTTANGGSVTLNKGFLEVASGSNANAAADLETVDRVIYESGRQLEAAIKVAVQDAPEDGAIAEWGLGTDDNGAYFRLSDGTFSVVYENGGNQVVTSRDQMRGDDGVCERFDPTSDAAIYTVRFNWYGAGGAAYYVYFPSDLAKNTLYECLLHWEAPDDDGKSWTNPNLPIFARVDNSESTSNDSVTLTVGGRRAGTQGTLTQKFRPTGDYRIAQSVASADGLVPLICVRRKSTFPTPGQLNAVPLKLAGFDISSDQDTVAYFVVGPDLTGASWGAPTFAVSAETAIETDTSSTALSSAKHVGAPFLIQGGSGNQQGPARGESDVIVPFIGEQPTCLAASVETDAVITSALRVSEGW